MTWSVVFYESSRGDRLVEDFIVDQLDLSSQDRVKQVIDLLQENGLSIGSPHAKYLKRDLWELRVVGKVSIRILFTIQLNQIILLHAFKKKSNRLLRKELDVAEKRRRNLLDN